jgi:hypothetical protein
MLASEVGFDILECGMESSFSWEQRQVHPFLGCCRYSRSHSLQCLDDSNNSPVAPLIKFLSDVRRGAR